MEPSGEIHRVSDGEISNLNIYDITYQNELEENEYALGNCAQLCQKEIHAKYLFIFWSCRVKPTLYFSIEKVTLCVSTQRGFKSALRTYLCSWLANKGIDGAQVSCFTLLLQLFIILNASSLVDPTPSLFFRLINSLITPSLGQQTQWHHACSPDPLMCPLLIICRAMSTGNNTWADRADCF